MFIKKELVEPENKLDKLKNNWILQTDSMGIPFYLCLIDGHTTYDSNEAIESVDQNKQIKLTDQSNTCDLDCLKSLTKELHLGSNNKLNSCFDLNQLNDASSNDQDYDLLNMHKASLEKNVFIKWRNRNELLEQKTSFDNFDSIAKINIDRAIFNDLYVGIEIKYILFYFICIMM